MVSDGLVSVRSRDGFAATVERLAAAIEARGLMLFADIDHAHGAAEVGLQLRPTRVLIFGHPRRGTPLMQACQIIGIDLPQRVLVWEDETTAVWVTYQDPTALARRYGLREESEPDVNMLSAVLQALARAAAGSGD